MVDKYSLFKRKFLCSCKKNPNKTQLLHFCRRFCDSLDNYFYLGALKSELDERSVGICLIQCASCATTDWVTVTGWCPPLHWPHSDLWCLNFIWVAHLRHLNCFKYLQRKCLVSRICIKIYQLHTTIFFETSYPSLHLY